MPNITTPYPRKTGKLPKDVANIQDLLTSLIDELTQVLYSLGPDNVLEAAKVKAQHIDTNTAKIKDAQIETLTADKITAGTIDSDLITIKGENGSMVMEKNYIKFYDNYYWNEKTGEYEPAIDPKTGKNYLIDPLTGEHGQGCLRIEIGDVNGEYDKFTGEYISDGDYQYNMYSYYGDENKSKVIEKTVSLDDDGNAVFTGTVEASKVVGGEVMGTVLYTEELDKGKNYLRLSDQFLKAITNTGIGAKFNNVTFENNMIIFREITEETYEKLETLRETISIEGSGKKENNRVVKILTKVTQRDENNKPIKNQNGKIIEYTITVKPEGEHKGSSFTNESGSVERYISLCGGIVHAKYVKFDKNTIYIPKELGKKDDEDLNKRESWKTWALDETVYISGCKKEEDNNREVRIRSISEGVTDIGTRYKDIPCYVIECVGSNHICAEKHVEDDGTVIYSSIGKNEDLVCVIDGHDNALFIPTIESRAVVTICEGTPKIKIGFDSVNLNAAARIVLGAGNGSLDGGGVINDQFSIVKSAGKVEICYHTPNGKYLSIKFEESNNGPEINFNPGNKISFYDTEVYFGDNTMIWGGEINHKYGGEDVPPWKHEEQLTFLKENIPWLGDDLTQKPWINDSDLIAFLKKNTELKDWINGLINLKISSMGI